jgi:hypothetical protein
VSSEKGDAWRRRGGLSEARLGKPSSQCKNSSGLGSSGRKFGPRELLSLLFVAAAAVQQHSSFDQQRWQQQASLSLLLNKEPAKQLEQREMHVRW